MILNKQKKVRLAIRPLGSFLRQAQRELKIDGSEITVAFVSDAEIAQWNEAYRKKKGPTDVLSFPAVSGASRRVAGSWGRKAGEILGDIAIAPETAQPYAKKSGRSLA